MIDRLLPFVDDHRSPVCQLLHGWIALDRPLLLRTDLWDEYERFVDGDEGSVLRGSVVEEMVRSAREAVIRGRLVYLAVRPRIGRELYLRFNVDVMRPEEVSVAGFLAFKDRLVEAGDDRRWTLEVDLGPFNHDVPVMREARSVGRGVQFLNRVLSRRMFREQERGFDRFITFLRLHRANGQQLMLADHVRDLPTLSDALERALDHLESVSDDAEGSDVAPRLAGLGFEPGWGRSVASIRDSMSMLLDILEAPASLA